MLSGDKSDMPGMIRASFGLYNNYEDIDALTDALLAISKGSYQGNYLQDKSTGEFLPEGWAPEFKEYFSLEIV